MTEEEREELIYIVYKLEQKRDEEKRRDFQSLLIDMYNDWINQILDHQVGLKEARQMLNAASRY